MTSTILVVGIGLLVILAGGVMLVWIADARRADQVASDPERVEGRAPDRDHRSRRRRWPPTQSRR